MGTRRHISLLRDRRLCKRSQEIFLTFLLLIGIFSPDVTLFSTTPFRFLSFHITILGIWTPTSAPCSSLRRSSSTTSTAPSLARRGPNKRKINLDRLIQQLGIMRSVNRSSSLVQCRVFDERVTLIALALGLPHSIPPTSTTTP